MEALAQKRKKAPMEFQLLAVTILNLYIKLEDKP
jgi:hypothetical protein